MVHFQWLKKRVSARLDSVSAKPRLRAVRRTNVQRLFSRSPMARTRRCQSRQFMPWCDAMHTTSKSLRAAHGMIASTARHGTAWHGMAWHGMAWRWYSTAAPSSPSAAKWVWLRPCRRHSSIAASQSGSAAGSVPTACQTSPLWLSTSAQDLTPSNAARAPSSSLKIFSFTRTPVSPAAPKTAATRCYEAIAATREAEREQHDAFVK